MSSPRPLKRVTTAKLVAEDLRRRIMRGEIGDGTRLRQDAIARELGVSRIPVREALKELEAEGFVVLKSHRSAVVSKLSLSEISEMFELRELLEPWVLGLAVPLISDEDIEQAATCIEQMSATKRLEDWGALNWAFHEALYRPSGRTEVLKILQRIHANMDRYVRLQISLTAGQQRAHREHEEILRLVQRREAAKALAALKAHIRGVHEALLDGLGQSSGDDDHDSKGLHAAVPSAT